MYIENDREIVFDNNDEVPEYLNKLIKDFPITPSIKYLITDSKGNDIIDLDWDEIYEISKNDMININIMSCMFDYDNCKSIENLVNIPIEQFIEIFEYPLNRAFYELYIKYFENVTDIFNNRIENEDDFDDVLYKLDDMIYNAYDKMNEHPDELRELFINFYKYMFRKIDGIQAHYKAIHHQPDNYFTDDKNNCVYFVARCQYATLYTRIPTKR